MSDNVNLEKMVKIYKALGEPTRMRVVLLLAKHADLCCSEVEEILQPIASSTLSHHLKQLSDCGLLFTKKRGTYIYYGVNKEILQQYAPILLL
ncbi:metalloregulator ArsR/SmtB family transcription factor [Acinetobacter pittii]|uniref:ArsR/SmtB family transcription factor n=1 Tax=Acinetobacter pittii TaxID=48296 RepID=UPI002952A7BD|nr:metalloregulator ArsR/SmtB family transcription factor [Acinetobacter pittii]MDV8153903.1 metalloregulator ArsR/SmtB family transcription factor [Acinetobacter pittii]